MTDLTRSGELYDTASIRAFMTAMGQDVRESPTADVPDSERVLRGKLNVEETLELTEAMGLKVTLSVSDLQAHLRQLGLDIVAQDDTGTLTDLSALTVQVHRSEVHIEIDPTLPVDLVEMAKESADLTYVNKGTMLAFGLPADAVFDAVHQSNMSKLDDEGKPIRREDGKIIKGANYRPADVSAIVRIPGQQSS